MRKMVRICARLCRTLGKWRAEFCAALDAENASGDDGSRCASREGSAAADPEGDAGAASRHHQVRTSRLGSVGLRPSHRSSNGRWRGT